MKEMSNATQVKRKHFRFPAYSDELGVKLPISSEHVLFQDEPLITDGPAFGLSPLSSKNVAEKKKNSSSMPIGGNHPKKDQKQEHLTKHKSDLPDYLGKNSFTTSEHFQKKSLFKDVRQKNQYNFPSSKIKQKDSLYDEHPFFVPTYTPASLIQENEQEKAEMTNDTLMAAMKKEQSTYLLFEEAGNFNVKQHENESVVKKFNRTSKMPEISVTRRQYQQIRPDIERFGHHSDYSLPRSRKELKTAKDKAKNQTAYSKKMSELEEKAAEEKKHVLDKSLEGMIEDSNLEMKENKYFDS